MSAYIQSKTTGHYLRTLGSWSRYPKEAYRFVTVEAAVVFCIYHEIKDVLVIDESKQRARGVSDRRTRNDHEPDDGTRMRMPEA